MSKQLRQYGLWTSPIHARSLKGDMRLLDVQWDSDGETLVWLEGRAKQSVLVMQRGFEAPRDLTVELSVRGGVGYGGGEFTVRGGVVIFAASDGRLYRQSLEGGSARSITPAFGRVASPALSADGRWVAYVHTDADVDGLALVDASGESWPRKLAFGTDFVMQPTWHPGGELLAYVTWNHPYMPWDSTELKLMRLALDATGAPYPVETHVIASGASVIQPEFSPDGKWLAYLSDASGWWQLYLCDLAAGTHHQLTYTEAEHGIPPWVQGMRTYGWCHDSRHLYNLRNDVDAARLVRVDVREGRELPFEALDEYTELRQIAVSPGRDSVAMLASSGLVAERLISFEPQEANLPLHLSADSPGISVLVEQGRGLHIHRRSSAEHLTPAQLAKPQSLVWTGEDGETVYGVYYPPASDRFESPGLPPLIVDIHGGPTSQARPGFNSEAQFYATRGFAFLEVNHRGSTGYGKAYKDKLIGGWGVYDVMDAASGAQFLVERGLVDPARLIIQGGSAGGFTVLQSLVQKPGFYRAGICAYGIANQFSLLLDAQFKFESQYSVTLLGALPDAAAVYRERSPLFNADRIVDPVIIFQGDEDNVVPKSQADSIVAVLRRRGVPHEYHVFAGEGHGFRKPETIEAYYTAVMNFLKQHVLFV